MELFTLPDYVMDCGSIMDDSHWGGQGRPLKRKQSPGSVSPTPTKKPTGEPWDQLAGDFDGSCSLSSINDLGSSSFQNSDALLSLPNLSAFKQELSPFSQTDGGGSEASNSPQWHKPYASAVNKVNNGYENGMNGVDYLSSPQSDGGSSAGSNLIITSAPATSTHAEDCRFQYVLAAATSIATKVNEETLTYLNQGQSYEIKLKKLGDLSEYKGKILKSVVRLVFHERRLQYMEREQLAAWEASHPGDSILEVDLPLSYGLLNLSQRLNTIDFLWEPTKEVGVYIKVNCISTEFTPKKHGGEKGVPFRIQVETYLQGEQGAVRHLHTASCQIKVFKLKGADRKHKQDREKIQKRPLIEQEKYQCSYDCTILSEVPLNGDNTFPPLLLNSGNSAPSKLETPRNRSVPSEDTSLPQPSLPSPCDTSLQKYEGLVSPGWTPQETQAWLQANRYTAHLQTLASYGGSDLLRLSKENLVQLCGLPDGIRLHNALHARVIPPRLTLYLSLDSERDVYEGVYLKERSRWEMVGEVAKRAGVGRAQVGGLYLEGPGGIRVAVTDSLVAHLPDHSAFSLHVVSHDAASDSYHLLLKRSNICSSST